MNPHVLSEKQLPAVELEREAAQIDTSIGTSQNSLVGHRHPLVNILDGDVLFGSFLIFRLPGGLAFHLLQ